MSKTKEEAREDLLKAMPHFRNAVASAKARGQVRLGILSINPDGSGHIDMSFECDQFFTDLALLIDAPPYSDKDKAYTDAVRFQQEHHLTIGKPS